MLSSTFDSFATRRSERKPFHILTTKFLEGNEVLVHFSDGTAAIFEAEELEKLRPTPKRMLPCTPKERESPVVMEPALAVGPAVEPERPFVLDEAVA
ncbi:MAG TPA: hypothetical protein VJU82_02830 [Acidobacteriaceae bacterium]|nr:hypothetical protein [Acidobacteriaceae bacterium]